MELIAQMQLKSRRKGRLGLDVATAIDVAWREGRLDSPRKPAASSMRRRMQELQLNPRRLTLPSPHVHLISTHSNHVHQVDASLCIQYRFGRKGFEYRVVDLNKIDKTRKIKQAIHRWLIVDHLSGAYLTWYVDSPGEATKDLLEFLYWAWGPKKDTRIPVCGVPDLLYVDPGSVFRSSAVSHLCQSMGIDLRHHQAERARSTGSAEVSHWIHERRFEAKLRLQQIDSVEALIEKARLEDIYQNTTAPHTRHGRTRFDAWQQAASKPLRVPLEYWDQWLELATGKSETRQVSGDLTISWQSQRYYLPDAQVREQVLVKPHPFDAQKIQVLTSDNTPLEVRLVTPDEWGRLADIGAVFGQEHKRRADTPVQTQEKAAEQLEPFSHAFLEQEDLPKDLYAWDPLPIEPARAASAPVDNRILNRVEAKDMVIAHLGRPLSREEGRWWNQQIGDGITQGELETLLRASQEGGAVCVA